MLPLNFTLDDFKDEVDGFDDEQFKFWISSDDYYFQIDEGFDNGDGCFIVNLNGSLVIVPYDIDYEDETKTIDGDEIRAVKEEDYSYIKKHCKAAIVAKDNADYLLKKTRLYSVYATKESRFEPEFCFSSLDDIIEKIEDDVCTVQDLYESTGGSMVDLFFEHHVCLLLEENLALFPYHFDVEIGDWVIDATEAYETEDIEDISYSEYYHFYKKNKKVLKSICKKEVMIKKDTMLDTLKILKTIDDWNECVLPIGIDLYENEAIGFDGEFIIRVNLDSHEIKEIPFQEEINLTNTHRNACDEFNILESIMSLYEVL